MSVLTADKAIERVDTAAQKRDREVRITKHLAIGRAIQQGDIYVHAIEPRTKLGKRIAGGSVQVAVGQNASARHIAVGDLDVYESLALPPGVSFPSGVSEADVRGPTIVARKPWRLPHPEHAEHSLPAGTFQVTYQFDARTMKRVVD